MSGREEEEIEAESKRERARESEQGGGGGESETWVVTRLDEESCICTAQNPSQCGE